MPAERPQPSPVSTVLSGDEACTFFESLAEGRRELVWVRCARMLDIAVEEIEDIEGETLDEVWDLVVTEMWCQDRLARLVELGRLERQSIPDGRILFLTPLES